MTTLALPSQRPPAKLPWAESFTPAVGERICDEIAAGRTLARICIEEPWAPGLRTAHLWQQDHPEFRDAYAEARRIRADAMAQELVELSDTAKDLDRLPYQLQSRQWLASRMLPHAYGDKRMVDQTITAKVTTTMTHSLDVSGLSLDELLLLERALNKTIEGEVVRDEG
jgi:hypothetical protein